MEPIHTHLCAILPLPEETHDATNRRIRRVVHLLLFGDEAQVDPEAITNSLIGVEKAGVFPGEEEHIWRCDDLVWTGGRKVRMHLSRSMAATA